MGCIGRTVEYNIDKYTKYNRYEGQNSIDGIINERIWFNGLYKLFRIHWRCR